MRVKGHHGLGCMASIATQHDGAVFIGKQCCVYRIFERFLRNVNTFFMENMLAQISSMISITIYIV